MQRTQLVAGIVEAIDLGESLQPRLPALLIHHTVRSPRGQFIVEPLVRGSYSVHVGVRFSGLIKTCQVLRSEIGSCGLHPRITSIAYQMRETAVVLKDESRI